MKKDSTVNLSDFYAVFSETEEDGFLFVTGTLFPWKWDDAPTIAKVKFPPQQGPRDSWVGEQI